MFFLTLPECIHFYSLIFHAMEDGNNLIPSGGEKEYSTGKLMQVNLRAMDRFLFGV
jgi:hypothetical protein